MSITVAIYERDLVAANACAEGIELWRRIAEQSKRSKKGELRVKVTWTRLHLLWFATAYPSFYAWCRDKGIIPQTSLRSANLRSANLRSANLSSANLYDADLYDADLGGANLRSANLYGANLGGADLYGANLYDADLGGANLRSANLYGANLSSANLRSADLYDANLCGADLGEWERDDLTGYARRKTA